MRIWFQRSEMVAFFPAFGSLFQLKSRGFGMVLSLGADSSLGILSGEQSHDRMRCTLHYFDANVSLQRQDTHEINHKHGNLDSLPDQLNPLTTHWTSC